MTTSSASHCLILALLLLAGPHAVGAALPNFDVVIQNIHVDLTQPDQAVQFLYAYHGPMETEDDQVSLDFVVWKSGCDTILYQEGENTPPVVYTHSITEIPDDNFVLVNVAVDLEHIQDTEAVWTQTEDDLTTASLAFCGRFEVHYGDGSSGKDRILADFHEVDFSATIRLLMGFDEAEEHEMDAQQMHVEQVMFRSASGEFGQETFPLDAGAASNLNADLSGSASLIKDVASASDDEVDDVEETDFEEEYSAQSSEQFFTTKMLLAIFAAGLVFGGMLVSTALWLLRSSSNSEASTPEAPTVDKKKVRWTLARSDTNMTSEASESSTSESFSEDGGESPGPYIVEV